MLHHLSANRSKRHASLVKQVYAACTSCCPEWQRLESNRDLLSLRSDTQTTTLPSHPIGNFQGHTVLSWVGGRISYSCSHRLLVQKKVLQCCVVLVTRYSPGQTQATSSKFPIYGVLKPTQPHALQRGQQCRPVTVFQRILNNEQHGHQPLLPDINNTNYNLRTRQHDIVHVYSP